MAVKATEDKLEAEIAAAIGEIVPIDGHKGQWFTFRYEIFCIMCDFTAMNENKMRAHRACYVTHKEEYADRIIFYKNI